MRRMWNLYKIYSYGAIKIGKDGKATIDEEKCQKCGKCKEACPFDAIKVFIYISVY